MKHWLVDIFETLQINSMSESKESIATKEEQAPSHSFTSAAGIYISLLSE